MLAALLMHTHRFNVVLHMCESSVAQEHTRWRDQARMLAHLDMITNANSGRVVAPGRTLQDLIKAQRCLTNGLLLSQLLFVYSTCRSKAVIIMRYGLRRHAPTHLRYEPRRAIIRIAIGHAGRMVVGKEDTSPVLNILDVCFNAPAWMTDGRMLHGTLDGHTVLVYVGIQFDIYLTSARNTCFEEMDERTKRAVMGRRLDLCIAQPRTTVGSEGRHPATS